MCTRRGRTYYPRVAHEARWGICPRGGGGRGGGSGSEYDEASHHPSLLLEEQWWRGRGIRSRSNAANPGPVLSPISPRSDQRQELGPRRGQGDLAKKYGIDGFIYHHYWFYDRAHPGPNLAVPLLNMLDDGHPDLPFFLNWCSLRWVNTWMGNAMNRTAPTDCVDRRNQRMRCPPVTLQEQYFDPTRDEIETHYKWLSRFFRHEKYIRIRNQPVMLLYHYDGRAVPIIEELRKLAIEDGLDGIYWIIGRKAAPDEIFALDKEHPSLVDIIKEQTQTLDMLPLDGVFNQSMTYPYPLKWVNTYEIPEWCRRGRLREEAAPGTRQEVTGILTAFDNTPRRQYDDATIYGADAPSRILTRFRTNLRTALYYGACCQRQTEDQFVVINAWNEWGEGMALEPSDTYGRGFLEIIHEVKEELRDAGCDYN